MLPCAPSADIVRTSLTLPVPVFVRKCSGATPRLVVPSRPAHQHQAHQQPPLAAEAPIAVASPHTTRRLRGRCSSAAATQKATQPLYRLPYTCGVGCELHAHQGRQCQRMVDMAPPPSPPPSPSPSPPPFLSSLPPSAACSCASLPCGVPLVRLGGWLGISPVEIN